MTRKLLTFLKKLRKNFYSSSRIIIISLVGKHSVVPEISKGGTLFRNLGITTRLNYEANVSLHYIPDALVNDNRDESLKKFDE